MNRNLRCTISLPAHKAQDVCALRPFCVIKLRNVSPNTLHTCPSLDLIEWLRADAVWPHAHAACFPSNVEIRTFFSRRLSVKVKCLRSANKFGSVCTLRNVGLLPKAQKVNKARWKNGGMRESLNRRRKGRGVIISNVCVRAIIRTRTTEAAQEEQKRREGGSRNSVGRCDENKSCNSTFIRLLRLE